MNRLRIWIDERKEYCREAHKFSPLELCGDCAAAVVYDVLDEIVGEVERRYPFLPLMASPPLAEQVYLFVKEKLNDTRYRELLCNHERKPSSFGSSTAHPAPESSGGA